MKQRFILPLCTVALLAFVGNTAQAQIDVQLNLSYTRPSDPSLGGTWDLLVQANNGGGQGMAGIQAIISGIDLGGITAGAFDGTLGISIFDTLDVSGDTEIAAGADLSGTPDLTVGTVGGTGDVAVDDLVLGGAGAGWENSALIASGTFSTAVRPSFTSIDVNEFIGGVATGAAIGISSVRGDSLASLALNTPGTAGLLFGDSNRDGVVSLSTDLFPALGRVGLAGPFTWDEGAWNAGDDIVSLSTDIFPTLGNIGLGAPGTPALSAVPEPTSLLLCLLATVGFAGSRRLRVR